MESAEVRHSALYDVAALSMRPRGTIAWLRRWDCDQGYGGRLRLLTAKRRRICVSPFDVNARSESQSGCSVLDSSQPNQIFFSLYPVVRFAANSVSLESNLRLLRTTLTAKVFIYSYLFI
jgi:hypothetical protein